MEMAGSEFSNFGNAVLDGLLDIETINPTCIQWWRASEGFGVRDTVKGMVPGHVCIVQVCFTQGFQEDRNQTRA